MNRPLPPAPTFADTTDDLDAPLTPAEARARLADYDARLAADPDDGMALAGWLISNYWAHQPETE